MSLPLLNSEATGNELWIALAVGVAFGFFLEQGGMGSARKIAGQFYLRDLAVLKIMFSAILTAAIGLFWFARIGLLDYDRLFVEPTFLGSQAVGGLIFGAGFVIGGLCPGTSCVAASSGRLDGVVLLAGMLGGILIFNESFPLIEGLYRSGALGPATLPDVLGISYGVSLVILVAVALGAFRFAHWAEKRAAS